MDDLATRQCYAAFLFDMDGTILTSARVVERTWAAWAREHGVDVEALLATVHGVRAEDLIRQLSLPGLDAVVEAKRLADAEMADVEGIEAIAGAAELLAGLPPERWAIVTSAPRMLAEHRIAAAGLPRPNLIIAAEDVLHGKPSPDCFLLAAKILGFPPEDCLVFEDSLPGLCAAESAGMSTVAIGTSRAALESTTSLVMRDYSTVHSAQSSQGCLRLLTNGRS